MNFRLSACRIWAAILVVVALLSAACGDGSRSTQTGGRPEAADPASPTARSDLTDDFMEAVRASRELGQPDFASYSAQEDMERSEWVALGVVESVDVAERSTFYRDDEVVDEQEHGVETQIVLGVEIQVADASYVKHPEACGNVAVEDSIFIPFEYYYEHWTEEEIDYYARLRVSELQDTLIESAPLGARVLVSMELVADELDPSPYSFFVENEYGLGVGYMDSDDFTDLLDLASSECGVA